MILTNMKISQHLLDNFESPNIKATISEMQAVELLKGATYAGEVPNGLAPHDLDWNDKKVEVKMSTTYPIWQWKIKEKQLRIADYILLMGYKEHEFKRAFLIPKSAIEHRDFYRGIGFRVSDKKTLPFYIQYEVVDWNEKKEEK